MNILCIVIDCGRFDSWGCNGFNRNTPNIDNLAEKSILYTNAYTTAPYTPAAIASLFTGKYPYEHGIRTMYGSCLDSDVKTVPEILQGQGWNTAGFVGYAGLLSYYGLDRGFNFFDEDSDLSKNWGKTKAGWKGNDWRKMYTSYCKNLKKDNNFIFAHYFFAHTGGEKALPEEYKKADTSRHKYFQYYDKKIEWFDKEWLPLILEPWDLDNTAVIMLADHGECFDVKKEPGGHRTNLFQDTVHIPLMIHDIVIEGGGIDSKLKSNIDIFSNITECSHTADTIYFETTNEDKPDQPTFRAGLTDGKKKVTAEGENIGEIINIEGCYEVDEEKEKEIDLDQDCGKLFQELMANEEMKREMNVKWDAQEAHIETLKQLGYM